MTKRDHTSRTTVSEKRPAAERLGDWDKKCCDPPFCEHSTKWSRQPHAENRRGQKKAKIPPFMPKNTMRVSEEGGVRRDSVRAGKSLLFLPRSRSAAMFWVFAPSSHSFLSLQCARTPTLQHTHSAHSLTPFTHSFTHPPSLETALSRHFVPFLFFGSQKVEYRWNLSLRVTRAARQKTKTASQAYVLQQSTHTHTLHMPSDLTPKRRR